MTDLEARLNEIRQRRKAIGEGNWTYEGDISPDNEFGDKSILVNGRMVDGWLEHGGVVAYDEGVITDETGRFIAHAPSDVDQLLSLADDLVRLREVIRENLPHVPDRVARDLRDALGEER